MRAADRRLRAHVVVRQRLAPERSPTALRSTPSLAVRNGTMATGETGETTFFRVAQSRHFQTLRFLSAITERPRSFLEAKLSVANQREKSRFKIPGSSSESGKGFQSETSMREGISARSSLAIANLLQLLEEVIPLPAAFFCLSGSIGNVSLALQAGIMQSANPSAELFGNALNS
jgi:hypothetical protein